MKVKRIKALELGTDPVNGGERLRAYYTNQGEPYREGCQIALEIPFEGWPRETASIFLETHEAAALRDWLDKFIPKQ